MEAGDFVVPQDQASLTFEPESADVEVTIKFCFIYEEARYSPSTYYDGPFQF
jgi:hypothetical protein